MTREDGKRAACGRVITFVLALGAKSETGIEDVKVAIEAARRAQVPAVFVLASPEQAPDALEAVRTSGRRDRMLLQAIEYDPVSAIELTRDAGDFELYGLPFGLLETMRVLAESVLDVYESVLVMDAAQSAITTEHVFALCNDARSREGIDVVASWIEGLRRLPLLVSRDFLEGLAEAPYAQPMREGAAGARALPHVNAFDHVFGEEKLAADARVRPAVSSFLDRCTCSALEAVHLAKVREGDGSDGSDGSDGASGTGGSDEPAASKPLNNVDALLVQTAQRIRSQRVDLSEEERADLDWANAFGEKCRRDFPLLNDDACAGKLAYLDSAATTQRAAAALAAQREFDERGNANVYRGSYELSAQATRSFDEARATLARFIGAEAAEVAFTSNATAAINLVALAWGERAIGTGDVIVCERCAHHANMLPFSLLAERKGACVVYVDYGDDGRIDRDAYAAALELQPKLVCIAHVGNVLGVTASVRELAEEAHARGARVLVDAAQSFSLGSVNVRELGADWVAMSAHKAYGPLGIGALWSAPEAFAEMEPVCAGGGVVSHVSTETRLWKPDATRFEPGTPPISQAIGWAAAIEYLEQLGARDVARHAAVLTRYAVRGLERLDGVNVVGDHGAPDGQAGIVAFTVRSVSPGDLGTFLGKLGVAIRSGGHCALPLHASLGLIGTGRISIGVHTTADDIDAALTAIDVCRQAYES